MPIITPAEYPALKAQGLISLVKQPDGKIRVTINRGETEAYTKANILAWLADERKILTDQVTILDTIKADIDPIQGGVNIYLRNQTTWRTSLSQTHPLMQLTPNFSLDEFRCKCCGQVNTPAAQALATRLQKVRDEYGIMRIVSGFRCPRQNENVGGKTFSPHLCGLAADIACASDIDRRRLLMLLLQFGFPRIGISHNFIHADIGTITGPLIWVY